MADWWRSDWAVAARQRIRLRKHQMTAEPRFPSTRDLDLGILPTALLISLLTANVVLANRNGGNGALLPLSSIYRKGDAAAVWIYDEKARTVALRPVTVGQYREDGVIVTAGIGTGEWIVTAGVHKLREGEIVP